MEKYQPARGELIDSNQRRAELQAQVREVSAIPADSTVGTVPLQRRAASAEMHGY
jgi:hypothetical protein